MRNLVKLMSRIGKQPIKILEGVDVKIDDNIVTVKGPKGELKEYIRPEIKVEIKEKEIILKPLTLYKGTQALWGTYRSNIANMIQGVTNGFEKKLEIVGVGYKANLEGKDLILNLGHSHPIKIEAPEKIEFVVEKHTITVSGINKQLVGQVAAEIRSKRKPEPYKGKGVRYKNEVVRRKAGKKAVGTE